MIAFALAYLLAWFGALFGLPELPEHELQLFMASHYAQAPFSLLDERWYGGFDVAWRPPAFYVCTAVLARLPGIGLERAYALLVICSVLGFVFATSWLVRMVRPSLRPAELLAVNPLLFAFAFALGQSAFVAACALCAVQAAAALEYLREQRVAMAVVAVSAAVLAPLVHPLALVLVAAAWVGVGIKHRVALLALLPSLSISAFVLLPFFAANRAIGSGPVSHDKWLLVASVCIVLLQPYRRYAVPALLVVCCYVLGDHASAAPARRYREAVAAAEYALSKPDALGHRYITLGLGSERLAMSRRTLASLADGGIPWVLPYESVDGLPLGTQAGRAALETLLARGNLRWVVSASALAESSLRAHGYRLAAAWGGGVVLWEKDTPLVTESVTAKPAPWIWTMSGPVLLALLLLGLLYERALNPSRRYANGQL